MKTFQPNDYLTISFPKEIESIKGVIFSKRRIAVEKPQMLKFTKVKIDIDSIRSTWEFKIVGDPIDRRLNSDDMLVLNGYVVITPMTINENNDKWLLELKKNEVPKFPIK